MKPARPPLAFAPGARLKWRPPAATPGGRGPIKARRWRLPAPRAQDRARFDHVP